MSAIKFDILTYSVDGTKFMNNADLFTDKTLCYVDWQTVSGNEKEGRKLSSAKKLLEQFFTTKGNFAIAAVYVNDNDCACDSDWERVIFLRKKSCACGEHVDEDLVGMNFIDYLKCHYPNSNFTDCPKSKWESETEK